MLSSLRRVAARPAGPDHAGCAGQSGRGVPGQRPDTGGHRPLPEPAGPLRGDQRAGSSRHHHRTGQPGLGLPPRRAAQGRDSRADRRVLEDRGRTAGADHLDTITAQANLAFAYRSAGQLREAIREYERTLADRERLQGPDHADTRTARRNLAAAYQQAGPPRPYRSTSARWPTASARSAPATWRRWPAGPGGRSPLRGRSPGGGHRGTAARAG